MSQQANPTKAPQISIKRIKAEKAITCSLAIKKGEKSKIKAMSRVPMPDIEIGIRVINPATVTEIAKYKKGTLSPAPLAKIYI